MLALFSACEYCRGQNQDGKEIATPLHRLTAKNAISSEDMSPMSTWIWDQPFVT